MRLRKDNLAKEKLQNSLFQVNSFPFKVNADWVIELAMGKGDMISQLAAKNPAKFYLGIEKEFTVAWKAAQKAQALNLKNLQIICNDINSLPFLVEGQVAQIWLTFPDPWPKNRHQSRRLTSAKFLENYKKILLPSGILRFKTDNDKLFAWSKTSLIANNWKIIRESNDLHGQQIIFDNVITGYEQKWLNLNKKINYLEAKYLP